jgi:hypothetical protein
MAFVATCLGLTRPWSGDYKLQESLHCINLLLLHVVVFENVRSHCTHAICMLRPSYSLMYNLWVLMSGLLKFSIIFSYVLLYVCYYVLTCSLCVVFLGQVVSLVLICCVFISLWCVCVCVVICLKVRVLSAIWDCVCRSCASYFH